MFSTCTTTKFLALVVTALTTMLFLASSPAMAQSGLLKKKTKLAPITLSAGKPLAAAPYELEAGKYYTIDIVADGSQELGIVGPEFFRNLWIEEVVINDIEVRPLGLDSLEFDSEGKATIKFIPIRPGTFEVKIPNSRGDTQKATFVVKG
ncbi:MAG: hypothetical protein KDJ45_12750 [Hyphomicrobiaceae bacterium]|nr:hypothetical protein [Hyphomicrobiaceae bacterium]MCC0010830.1 hypothetical protein [Hyphomicrobiaceae bacterium]